MSTAVSFLPARPIDASVLAEEIAEHLGLPERPSVNARGGRNGQQCYRVETSADLPPLELMALVDAHTGDRTKLWPTWQRGLLELLQKERTQNLTAEEERTANALVRRFVFRELQARRG